MFGWCKKILVIDLGSGKVRIETPESKLYHKYIGGRGIAGHFLKDYITLDWNDEDMPIVFFTGPLANTMSPASSRVTVMSRSPLTGTIGDSTIEGSTAIAIKKAGLDGIIITGKSKRLSGIEICEDLVRITDASDLAGLETGRVHKLIQDGGATIIAGPAAENGVLFSNLAFDGRYASGRNGIGLCLSAKNIKYITVKGNCETGVFDPEGLNRACEDIRRLVAASPALLGKFGISNFGTLAFYDLIHSRRMMPTDNFRMTCFDAAPSMNAYVLMKKYQTTGSGCPSCYINCKRMTKDGIIMPEFDSMSHFSALLCNDDIATAIEADNICREMGMDPISAAGTLSCFSEISGKKLSSGEITELLTDIGKGRGVGIELGKGSFRYALSHGCPETSMTVKKQELPAYDPRGSYAMALAYATSTRGGCHLRAYPISYEILRKPVATDRFSFSGKARMVKVSEDLNAVVDSLSVCRFMFFAASLEEYARVYTAVTGMETSAHDLMKTGEAIYYNERMMNAKNGFTADDDDLPYRFFKEAGSSGGIVQIPPINRKDFLVTRSKYYAARGLDDKGMPLSDKPLKGSDS